MRHLPSLLIVTACLAASAQAEHKPTDQPNVLFILIDDLGWTDLSSAGSDFYETPHIDALAATGMTLTDAYAASPVCSPTRAAIMTGKHPARMATTDWFGAWTPERGEPLNWAKWHARLPLVPPPYVDHLPLEEVTLAEAFKAAGYATGFFGKWHFGQYPAYGPENQGFDVNIAGHDRGNPGDFWSPYQGMPGFEEITGEGEYLTPRLSRACRDFIRAHKDEPFLAYFSMYQVHTPLQAPEPATQYFRNNQPELPEDEAFGELEGRRVRIKQDHATYAAMVQAMDEAVGSVLAELEIHGLRDNTIVVFFSDNGGLSTAEGHPTSNEPLRAGKGWMYEGGIRVPCIVRWPGVTEPGSRSATPVFATDFFPTLVGAAGGDASSAVDGTDLRPLLSGTGELPDRALFWHYPHYGNQGGWPSSAIREGDWKLIMKYVPRGDQIGTEEMLFNLSIDLGETTNVLEQHPEVTARLYQRLRVWSGEVGARSPRINPWAE